jgi:hypothetical protein
LTFQFRESQHDVHIKAFRFARAPVDLNSIKSSNFLFFKIFLSLLKDRRCVEWRLMMMTMIIILSCVIWSDQMVALSVLHTKIFFFFFLESSSSIANSRSFSSFVWFFSSISLHTLLCIGISSFSSVYTKYSLTSCLALVRKNHSFRKVWEKNFFIFIIDLNLRIWVFNISWKSF